MTRIKNICVFLLFFSVLTGTALASHISLAAKPVSILRDGKVIVNIGITNQGDEPAMSVQVEGSVGGVSRKSSLKERLDVNEVFQAKLEIPDLSLSRGNHTVVLRIRYTDGNGYPFSALSTISLVAGNEAYYDKSISATLSSTAIAQEGKVALSLSVIDEQVDSVKVRLILPDEFGCFGQGEDVKLPDGGVKKEFQIRNESGRPGSIYGIFAIIDYATDKGHQSFSIPGKISIGKFAQTLPANGTLRLIVKILPIIILLSLFVVIQFSDFKFRIPDFQLSFLILLVLFVYTLFHVPPKYLLIDTMTVGGDTPAHNYMASHFKEQFFGHGRIASWGGGWWCGFPMFQFYFYLPYLLMSLLSFVIPFNIAFKLVTVMGIFLLPTCAYVSARMIKLRKPGPILVAIAMLPLLFDHSHTMWGVNIYSTFAGMIANSISFAIMLLFIGSASRDCDDGQFRLRTVFLLVALISSHFFTSLVAALTIMVLPFLRRPAEMRRAFMVLFREGMLALLLMAWWLVPLAVKSEYSMDFGFSWAIPLEKMMPMIKLMCVIIPFIVVALILGIVRKVKFVAVASFMLLMSLVLFFFGYDVSKVFQNIRFWPFLVYSLFALAAAGAGMLLEKLKARDLGIIIFLMVTLTFGISRTADVRSWARYNYEGIENKPDWPMFEELVLPLSGTPGRLANDLHADNEKLGSSRIFESVPHMIEKPVLEGGIVNSAAGSMYSYYIQGETSKGCAGFPNIVEPTTFNFANATKHLELFNVKHFIARWSETKKALAQSDDWKFLKESHGWELYELMSHDGSYVFIPEKQPLITKVDNWKQVGLDWIYNINMLSQPVVILGMDEEMDESFSGKPDYLTKVSEEKISDNKISFRTDAIGQPHVIKCTYYPNWKVRGAKKVYRVTPCFMLVYPEQEEVELIYGRTLVDKISWLLSLHALIVLQFIWWRRLDKTALLKFVDSTIGAILCRMLARRKRSSDPVLDANKIKRILVVRPGGMGDMILLLPVIKALKARFIEADIDIVCEKRNVEVLELAGLKKNALVYDAHPFKFLAKLRSRKYDVVIDAEQFHHFSAVFAAWSQAPVRIGFSVNASRNSIYTHQISYDLEGSEGEQFARLLEPFGIDKDKCMLENIFKDYEFKSDLDLCPAAPYIIIHNGTSTKYKAWSVDNFAQLIERLSKRYKVLLTGSKKEQKICGRILDLLSDETRKAVFLPGELDLVGIACLMKSAKLFVGSDSGLAHLCVAIGVPSVILFGPSDRRKWGFENAHHTVVSKELPCAPCFKFGSHEKCKTIACMNSITVKEVAESCSDILV